MAYLIILIAAIGIAFGAYTKGGRDATNRIEAEYLARAVVAQQEQREIKAKRDKAQRESDAKHETEVKTAVVDRDNARAALERLRKLIPSSSGTGINFPTAGVSPSTAALGDVFSHCAEKFTALGDEAAAARIAGLQCERYYDAIADKVKAEARPSLMDRLNKHWSKP